MGEFLERLELDLNIRSEEIFVTGKNCYFVPSPRTDTRSVSLHRPFKESGLADRCYFLPGPKSLKFRCSVKGDMKLPLL